MRDKKPLKKKQEHSRELTHHMVDETMETELNVANFPLLKKIHTKKRQNQLFWISSAPYDIWIGLMILQDTLQISSSLL